METLASIPADHVIYGVCDPCDRMEPVNVSALDPNLTLDDVRQRVRCSQCGRRTGSIRRVPTHSQSIR